MRDVDGSVLIDRQEIEGAMREFLAKGKQITVLQPQQVVSKNPVGGTGWEAFEPIEGLDYISSYPLENWPVEGVASVKSQGSAD